MNGSTQEYLFNRIREKLATADSLAEAVAERLHVSHDSAYRRIRGETPLVLEEARLLCESFRISLDDVFGSQRNSVSFQTFNVHVDDYDFGKYLSDMLQNLKTLLNSDEREIIYLTKDFVFFHNFYYRPLFAFRYFFWMKSILQHPQFVHDKFSMERFPPEIEYIGSQIAKMYSRIPSTEIWNTECVNSTIAQIEYYREAGYFASSTDVEKIYGALLQSIEHLRAQAEAGCKFLPGENPDFQKPNFQFYRNRVILGDNTIMGIVNGKKMLYLNYDVLNYMVTRNEVFCNEVHLKLQTLMKRSTLLSQDSEKQRNIFFNTLIKKIPNRSTTIH